MKQLKILKMQIFILKMGIFKIIKDYDLEPPFIYHPFTKQFIGNCILDCKLLELKKLENKLKNMSTTF